MSNFVIPDPSVVTWSRWAETVCGFNDSFKNQLWPELSWQEFARRLSQLEPATPRPEFFKDWKTWAAALRQALDR